MSERERVWWIYVCEEHGVRTPHFARRCSHPGYEPFCDREMARVQVVPADLAAELRAERDDAQELLNELRVRARETTLELKATRAAFSATQPQQLPDTQQMGGGTK